MMQRGRKRALGRGLDALLSAAPSPELMAKATLVPVSRIRPNRMQPRTHFDDRELQALTESIRKEGVLMPVLLRPREEGYELIAGERRWRAAQRAGLMEIPAIVREVEDMQALELAIIENEQRDDLTAIESARAYQRLIQDFGFTQQQVAERIGVSRTQVSNLLRLLQLPPTVQKMIENRKLDMGHARPLVGLPAAAAERLAKLCVAKDWSARQMEREAKKTAAATRSEHRQKNTDPDIAMLQDELGRHLGLPVELQCHKDGSGELRIRYSRPEELDGVLLRLRRAL